MTGPSSDSPLVGRLSVAACDCIPTLAGVTSSLLDS
jgi:hypothetical protein